MLPESGSNSPGFSLTLSVHLMNKTTTFTLSDGFKRLLFVALTLSALVGIQRVFESFQYPQLHNKDFLVDYLKAKAMLEGVDPYLPVPELVDQLIGEKIDTTLTHPSPHPPFNGVLALPFLLWNYATAVKLWTIFELINLMISTWMLFRLWGARTDFKLILLFGFFSLGWAPVVQSLWFGQLTTLLLTLLIAAWSAFRNERYVWAGVWIGCAIAIKLMVWPVTVIFLVSRKWRGIIATCAVLIGSNLIAAAVYGNAILQKYYFKIGPQVGSIYRSHDGNLSAWTWGSRLFAGTGLNIHALPLWESESLALISTWLLPAIILLAGICLAFRIDHPDTIFGLLVSIAILVSPIAWNHYLMLSIIPFMILAQRIREMGTPGNLVLSAFCFWFPISFTHLGLVKFAGLFATGSTAEGVPIVPFLAGNITLLPVFSLMGLFWFLLILQRKSPIIPQSHA